ncbi:MAG: O-antigen ligase family protein [SAR202 cluster bacterium]|nr:O-antigen ligase family protein [SAR202 cluster bacterium]
MPGYSDKTRTVFTTGNPGFAGLYMMLIFFIGFGLFKINFVNIPFSFLRLNKIKYLYKCYIYYLYVSITMFLLLYAIILTASRSVIPGLLFGIIMYVFLLFFSFRNQISQRNLINVICVIIFIFISIVLLFLVTGIIDTSIDRFVDIFNNQRESGDMGLSSRLSNINVSIKAFFERPLLGYGMNNYMIPYNKFVIPSQITSWEMDNAHNIFLHILITGGIFTFLTYLYLMFLIIVNSIREGRFNFSDKDYGLSGIMFVIPIFFVGYFIHQLFWFDIHESYLLLMIMFAIMNMSVKTPEIVINKLSKIKIIIKTIFGSIITRNARFVSVSIIISILLIFINIEMKMYQTASDIWDYSEINLSETKQGYLQSKVDKIMKAINRFPPMSNEATTFLINDSITLIPGLKEPSRSRLLNIAFLEGQNTIERRPNYWKLHARLGVLYYEASLISENEDDIIKYRRNAEKLFKDSIKLGPSRVDVYRMLINLYMVNDEYEKAAVIVEQYKNFLDSIHVELDSSYYQMNSVIEYGNCTNNSKDYFIINKCISEIK